MDSTINRFKITFLTDITGVAKLILSYWPNTNEKLSRGPQIFFVAFTVTMMSGLVHF
jgi:hypothetical protein